MKTFMKSNIWWTPPILNSPVHFYEFISTLNKFLGNDSIPDKHDKTKNMTHNKIIYPSSLNIPRMAYNMAYTPSKENILHNLSHGHKRCTIFSSDQSFLVVEEVVE